MIKLKLDFELKHLSGETLLDDKEKPLLPHKIAADALAKSAQGDPLKLYDLAQRFWESAVVELDQSDFDTARAALLASNLIPMIKAPIVRAFDRDRVSDETQKAL